MQAESKFLIEHWAQQEAKIDKTALQSLVSWQAAGRQCAGIVQAVCRQLAGSRQAVLDQRSQKLTMHSVLAIKHAVRKSQP